MDERKHCAGSNDAVAVQCQAFALGDDIIPPPPALGKNLNFGLPY